MDSQPPNSQLQGADGSALSVLGFSLTALHQGYRRRSFTVVDILRESLRRIHACKQPVFLHMPADHLLMQEAERQQGLLDSFPDALERWPLLGLPFAVKDNIDVAGMPTTAACPALQRLPTQSSPAVDALLQAGALCLGKTNMDQLATGLVGVRSPYGACRNAFLTEYISGGSSSGSGLAVALGLCCFALGTDTAGSGRVPAALGNILGMKPSRGAVSTRGVVPACPSLDCVSLFTLFADDAVHIFPHMGGYDALDPWSRRMPARTQKAATWSGLRLAIANPDQLDFAGDVGYAHLYQAALETAQSLGAHCLGQDIGPLYEAARLLYQGPWIAERYAAIAESIDPDSGQVLPVIREVLRQGRHMPATEAFRGQRRLQALKRSSESLFEACDVLMLPTMPTAFTVEAVTADPIALNAVLGRFTNFVNLLDLCAVAVPAGFREDGLPFGVTFIAPAFQDARLLGLAAAWERQTALGAGVKRWFAPESSLQTEPSHQGNPSGTVSSALTPAPTPTFTSPDNATLPLMVFGLHLRGQTLARDIENLGGVFGESTVTAAGYALYALSKGERRFPGVVRDPAAAGGLVGDLWHLPKTSLGAFLATLSSPLSLGFIELADGRKVVGFLAEAAACQGMPDITAYRGWLAYRKAAAL
jgi:allophanate hydrolase